MLLFGNQVLYSHQRPMAMVDYFTDQPQRDGWNGPHGSILGRASRQPKSIDRNVVCSQLQRVNRVGSSSITGYALSDLGDGGKSVSGGQPELRAKAVPLDSTT